MVVWLLLSLTGLLVEAATIALLTISGAAMEASLDAIVTALEYNAITLILSIVLQAGLVLGGGAHTTTKEERGPKYADITPEDAELLIHKVKMWRKYPPTVEMFS